MCKTINFISSVFLHQRMKNALYNKMIIAPSSFVQNDVNMLQKVIHSLQKNIARNTIMLKRQTQAFYWKQKSVTLNNHANLVCVITSQRSCNSNDMLFIEVIFLILTHYRKNLGHSQCTVATVLLSGNLSVRLNFEYI